MMGFTIKLPKEFCDAYEMGQKGTCTAQNITFDSKNPVVLVLVHGTFSNPKKFLGEIELSQDAVPDGFFQDTVYNNQKPIKITYGWSGENNDNARINGGKILAQGLNDIINQCRQQGIAPRLILMGHSHGGNVIAVASNKIQEPIDYAIFLATPVLRYNEKTKTNNDNDLYLPKSIKNLFLFYSMSDFVQTSGAATESFKRRYGPITGINLYNVHLLLKGQEPTHSGLYTQLIEDHIFDLCKKIKSLFTKNKNLVANIDPASATVDKLIAIKKYNAGTSNPLTGPSTDNLWPNWEAFDYAQNEVDENAISEKSRELFNNFYKREFIDTAPLLDRVAKGVQQEICVRAVGEIGSGFDVVPDSPKQIASKFCCWSKEFTEKHPSATKSLKCPAQAAPAVLTQNENESLCVNVIGRAGRLLGILPQSAKNDLKRRCCPYDSFKQKHPRASKAIECTPTT